MLLFARPGGSQGTIGRRGIGFPETGGGRRENSAQRVRLEGVHEAGASTPPGESRLVGLHLGGAVREGRTWLRVLPMLVGNDFPDVQGVRGTAELPVSAGTSWWTRWGYVAALAGVALLALRARKRQQR